MAIHDRTRLIGILQFGRNMIKEIIIVEGKDDISAVKRAVDAEVIATNGFSLPSRIKKIITEASKKRGIIILTDPDYAGEKIRTEVAKIAPNCKHAYIPRKLATNKDDIGVENASPEAIIDALKKAKCKVVKSKKIFTIQDMLDNDLTISDNSSSRRDILGSILGIGYGNTKQFLSRLNSFGITKEEFEEAMKTVNTENNEFSNT